MIKIKAGDIVKLKSGGPRLTVGKIDDDKVYVIWHDHASGEYVTYDFPEAALKFLERGDMSAEQMKKDFNSSSVVDEFTKNVDELAEDLDKAVEKIVGNFKAWFK